MLPASPPQIDNLGIPPLAGVCSYDRGAASGLTVDETVDRLRRLLYLKTQLNRVWCAHLSKTPEWELKCAFSLHLWLATEHATSIRQRIPEMREPPLHLDQCPDDGLAAVIEELLRSGNTLELISGIYGHVLPAMVAACKRHAREAHPIADHPTVRMLRHILLDDEETLAWGEAALAGLMQRATAADRAAADQWRTHIAAYLAHAGGVAGVDPIPQTAAPAPRWDGKPFVPDVEPRRDARFKDSFNESAGHADAYKNTAAPADERMLSLLYKRLREMGVPEYLTAVIARTPGKPWGYYAELSRQVCDEARHSMLGEAAMYRHGMAFYEFPVNINISTTFNTLLGPREVHACLWGVEQGLMARETGKPFERKLAEAYGDPFCYIVQDFDWADEVLHAQIGRRWLMTDFADRAALNEFHEAANAKWAAAMKTLSNRSEHHDWWPAFLAEVRRRVGRA